MNWNDEIPRIGIHLPNDNLSINDARLAVCGWGIARALKGDYVVRLTESPLAVAQLSWLNVDWDEGSEYEYAPSDRLGRYQQVAHAMGIEQSAPFRQAVDDVDEEITHVLFPSAPTDAYVAVFNHLKTDLPIIYTLSPQEIESVKDSIPYLQSKGYLPKAIWSYAIASSTPIFTEGLSTKWDVRQQFSVEQMATTHPTFQWEQLDQLNQLALQALPKEALLELVTDQLEDAYGMKMNARWVSALTDAIRPQLIRVEDVVDVTEWAFDPAPDFSHCATKLLQTEQSPPILAQFLAEITTVVLLDEPTTATILTELAKRFPNKPISAILQSGLTGNTKGASVASVAGLLGKSRCMERISTALRLAVGS